MLKKSFSFLRIIAISGCISIFELTVCFTWFRPEGADPVKSLVTVLLAAAVFLAALFLTIGRFASIYDTDLGPLQSEIEKYHEKLSYLGHVPLRGLVLFTVIQTALLGVLFSVPGFAPLREGIIAPIFTLELSLGLLNAAFVFVVSDSLTTKALLAQKLETYPAALRDDRQARKTFIIPMFMTVMSLVFAFSITYILLHDVGGELKKVSPKLLFGMCGTVVLYLTMVTVLVRVWNSTTARIYQSITSQLDSLNSAEKDLRGRIYITSIDELGTIAGLTNRFCATLESDIVDLKKIQGNLTETGLELQSNSETSGASVQQITSSIELLRDKTGTQSTSVGESSAAVRQIAKNIESLDGMIANQASSIIEASSSVEEMVGTIASINTSIERMAKEFGSLADEAKNGSGLQGTTGAKIQTIVDRSNSLQEANKVVAAIAAQTNLLAMNAAIEAAHAGDAGRGFSVVADEIRRLADTSSKESRKIKTEISEVQNSIQDVVIATRDSGESFGAIASRIEEIDALVRELHMAISEQNEGAKQILEALKQMNDITAQVRSGSQEMNSGSAIISTEMRKLLDSAQDVTANMKEMTASVGHVSESSRKVSEIVGITKEAIAGMNSVVSRFKTR